MASKLSQTSRITLTICVAEIFSMVGVFTFPALLPIFADIWKLSSIDSGWINGIYFGGYLIAVPILVGLTDFISPYRIYLIAIIISLISSAGFALVADGFWPAMVFRALGGVGLAGTYMPGLKLLTDLLDRTQGRKDNSRAITFYTTSFGLGAALSYFLAGELFILFGWQVTFGFMALGPFIAGISIFRLSRELQVEEISPPKTRLLDFRPIIRSKKTMGYVLAYTVHNFELFAYRSWMVAFLVHVASNQPNQTLVFSATVWATISNLLAIPFSILGNELSRKIGRHRSITAIMWASAFMASIIGFLGEQSFIVVATMLIIYGVFVASESPLITAGAINSAPEGYRGAAMAVYSAIGFLGSFSGPVIFGLVLDLSSISGVGGETTESWGWAFLVTGFVVALGPIFLFLSNFNVKD